ncbi:MAG: carbohydrate kinase family protein [bacterium]
MNDQRAENVDVVVAGHVCLDIIPTFPDCAGTLAETLVPGKLVNVGPAVMGTGGAVSNVGLALHRLGVTPRLMGKVGRDAFGGIVLEMLGRRDDALTGSMIVADDVATSYTVVINPPGADRIFLHCPGANDAFGADDVHSGAIAGVRLFHFGYPPLMYRMYADGGVELASMFRRVQALGVVTSLDLARPDPASPAGRADWRAILTRALPHVDIFEPSLEEILYMLDRPAYDRLLAGQPPDSAQLRRTTDELLAMGAAIVALKLGDQGLLLRTTSDAVRLESLTRVLRLDAGQWRDRELLAPCFVVQVVGTTGSGDATIAGLLAALLRGEAPEEAVTAAVAVGACSIEQADATSGIPAWDQIQTRISSGWARRRG